MRKLPFSLFAALLALCLVAVPAQALSLTVPPAPVLATAEEDEAEEAEVSSDEGAFEEEACEEDEEGFCEEEAGEGEECAVEDATAKLAAKPGSDSFELTVRYRSNYPAAVTIDSRLRGGRGGVHLGASRTRFRRSGVFRDSFSLGEKKMERALAAHEFEVEVRTVNAPRYCRLDLSGGLRRAKRPLRAGAPDRSGDPARTRSN